MTAGKAKRKCAYKPRKCEFCGADFAPTNPSGKRCHECQRVFFREYYRVYSATRDAAIAKCAARDYVQSRADAQNGGKPRVCQYCGKPIPAGRMSGYCAQCTREGYNNIHRATGRTNGWDAANRAAAIAADHETPDGWRGRRVAGRSPSGRDKMALCGK